jgi:DNA-directed RNA polymerase specialized sigma24 family protein
MSSAGSMTLLLRQLKAGDEAALAALHARYGPLLTKKAGGRLRGAGAPRRTADEEDVVQDAFWSFYQGLKDGKLPRLENRHDLLALLTHIVACRVHNHLSREHTHKRYAGPARGDSVLADLAAQAEPTPLEHALLTDCYRHYLDGLPDSLRATAELYLAGWRQTEIAAELNCVVRTVQRKLALILQRWQAMAAASLAE